MSYLIWKGFMTTVLCVFCTLYKMCHYFHWFLPPVSNNFYTNIQIISNDILSMQPLIMWLLNHENLLTQELCKLNMYLCVCNSSCVVFCHLDGSVYHQLRHLWGDNFDHGYFLPGSLQESTYITYVYKPTLNTYKHVHTYTQVILVPQINVTTEHHQ